ncbi:MAG: RNA polymerase sigma factor [Verrucomicrobiales bacterium]
MSAPASNPTSGGGPWFLTTHWSVVLAAKQGDPSEAAVALEKLCRTYWPPLYAYIRRDGHDATEAQDLTQEFFARLLKKDFLARLTHQRGKFRSFLLTFLKHFLSDQRDKARTQKRGGGQTVLSLDAGEGEEGYLSEPVDQLTPEKIFERRWVQTLLQRAFDRLAAEYVKVDNAAMFEALKDFQPRQAGSLTFAQIAADLGTTEAAVKSAMQRMRQRHGSGLLNNAPSVRETDHQVQLFEDGIFRGCCRLAQEVFCALSRDMN